MPTSYTSLLGLALPVTGELSGTWGDTVNNYITQYLDSSVAGTQIISGSQTAVTLSVTNGTSLVQVGSGSTGSAQYGIIRCSGNPASLLTITAPAASKSYLIINATSTSQSVKIVGTGPTTGVTIVSGESAVVAWNGSDFVKVATSTATGNVTAAGNNAFTGANTFYNATGQTFGTATAAQDGIILAGRAGGTSTYRVTLTPATLSSSTTLTLPNVTDTVATIGTAQTFTAAQTFRAANAIRSEAASTQDAVVIAGRAGGTSSYAATITPTTLTASRTVTLPDANTTIPVATQVLTFSGPTAARTYTLPDSASTLAALATAQTFTATQTFSGSSSTLGAILTDAAEVATVSATAATGTINYDVTTQSVLFYTTNASANWTVNLRGSSGTSMNTLMSTGQSVTVAFLVTQGATAYYNTTVQVDGTTSGVTTRWQGGAAPTAGNASGVDAYVYTIIKTGSATFSVFASQTQFK